MMPQSHSEYLEVSLQIEFPAVPLRIFLQQMFGEADLLTNLPELNEVRRERVWIDTRLADSSSQRDHREQQKCH